MRWQPDVALLLVFKVRKRNRRKYDGFAETTGRGIFFGMVGGF